MLQHAEILLPQAEQRRPVDLRIAADVVMQAGMEFFPVLAVPGVRRLYSPSTNTVLASQFSRDRGR